MTDLFLRNLYPTVFLDCLYIYDYYFKLYSHRISAVSVINSTTVLLIYVRETEGNRKAPQLSLTLHLHEALQKRSSLMV